MITEKISFNFVFSSAKISKFAKILNNDFSNLKGQRHLKCPSLLWLEFKAQHVLNRLSEEMKHPAHSAASCSWKMLFCCTILITQFAATTRSKQRSNRELMNKNQIKDLKLLWEKIWMPSLSITDFNDKHWERLYLSISLIFYSLSSHSCLLGAEFSKEVVSG